MKRAALALALGGFACIGLLGVACGEDSSSSSPGADGSVSPDTSSTNPGVDTGTPSPGSDSGSDAQPATDSGNGDGGIPTTPKGLRVTFLGVEHTYVSENETELMAFLAAETGNVVPRINPATLAAADLANVDILVAGRLTRAYTAPEVAVVAAWVASGKGLAALSGFGSGVTFESSLLEPYGIAFGGQFGGAGTYATTFAAHPLGKDVNSLFFYGGNPPSGAGDAGPEGGVALDWASNDATTMGTARAYGLGRVAVYGDDWVLFNQEMNRVWDSGVDASPADSGTYGPALPTRQFWHNVLIWTSKRSN